MMRGWEGDHMHIQTHGWSRGVAEGSRKAVCQSRTRREDRPTIKARP